MSDYVEIQSVQNPDQSAAFQELSQLHQKKLWHQLTIKINELSKESYFQTSPNFLQLHERFISSFYKKLNPLSYATFSLKASSQQLNNQAALDFLKRVQGQVETDAQAKLLIHLEITRYMMKGEEKEKEIETIKERIEESKKLLDSYAGVMSTEIYSLYYRTICEYATLTNDPNDFYTNALLFLTYTPLSTLSSEEQLYWAKQLSLSALIGSNIYNFGQLLQHDILKSLDNTESTWIKPFLDTFNTGNLELFHNLFISAAESSSLLADNAAFLQQKIRVMALIDLCFKQPSKQRIVTFKQIVETCQIEYDQVEWLLMKALALKVIKGTIDQIHENVRITWVQPRVLNIDQLKALRLRVENWKKNVEQAKNFIEENAKQIVQPSFHM